jgi:hypothetical protein
VACEGHTRIVTKFLDFLRDIFEMTIDGLLTQIIPRSIDFNSRH